LNRQGYTVIECDSPEIALSLWESEQSRVDLVLTETALPGKVSGAQLVKRLRAAKPGLKAVYTGTSTEPDQPGKNMVTKPYTAEDLLDGVEKGFASA
jgi:CheY-like chemotaxis protein